MSVFFPRISLLYRRSASSKSKASSRVLAPVVRLDSGNQNLLWRLLEQPETCVELDLGQVRFMDVHAVRTLKQVQAQFQAQGKFLKIHNLSDSARLTFELLGGVS